MEENGFNYLITLIPLVLGWLLGVLSSLTTEKIKKYSTKNEVKKGIKTELSELQIHLSSVCLVTTCQYGEFTRGFFNWVKPYCIKIFTSEKTHFENILGAEIPDISELSDDDLFNLIRDSHGNNNLETRLSAFTYQNVSTPYLDIKINHISLFTEKAQKLLITIKRDTNFVNNDIEQIWFYYSKTFDNITEENHRIINQNLENMYLRIGRRTRTMVNKINELFKEIN